MCIVCSDRFVVTKEMLAAGQLTVLAEVNATGLPDGGTAAPPMGVAVLHSPSASLELEAESCTVVNGILDCRFTVENTGTVALETLSVVGDHTQNCTRDFLAVAANHSCRAQAQLGPEHLAGNTTLQLNLTVFATFNASGLPVLFQIGSSLTVNLSSVHVFSEPEPSPSPSPEPLPEILHACMEVDLTVSGCIAPDHAPGVVTCPLHVNNTGNATLLLVTVQGQSSPCAKQLAPAEAVECTITHPVDQAAFDSWDAGQLEVDVTAVVVAQTAPYSDVPSLNGSVSASLALVSRQSVMTSVSVSPSAVSSAGVWARSVFAECTAVP